MNIIQNIKALLIGSAILDIECEKTNMPKSILPNINPYYYKIKKIDAVYTEGVKDE